MGVELTRSAKKALATLYTHEGREPACVRVCFPGAITLE